MASSTEKLPADPKVVFMGTPAFAVPALTALIDRGYDIRAVITQPDRPRGRGRRIAASPVKETAVQARIPVLQPEKVSDESSLKRIREISPDLVIVTAFGQILKRDLLSIPPWGALNIHASLLPRYRGAAPVQWAIIKNEAETGLTLMRMDEGLDTGPILFQRRLAVHEDDTAGRLHDRLAFEAGPFLVEALEEMKGRAVKEIPQDDSRATYAPKITPPMAEIDWTRPAEEISALIRGLDPWPGARTELAGKEIKLFSPIVLKVDEIQADPGRVVNAEGRLDVTAVGGIVRVREMQYPGKKRLPAPDFLRGFPIPVGSILGGGNCGMP